MSDIPQFDNPRQGARVVLRVPVEIRGVAADKTVIEESTYTGVVGVQGAMIWVSKALQIGAEVELTNRFSQRTAKFRVAWVKEPQGTELWETGVESLRPLDDFWGVRFPPKGNI
ncbi:MAG TPA: hypothetical protein VHS29_03185 [Candidatus Acidoferrales bacterium]|nr:hypothetical protein [Candidatus Acidoferrales bacterium]